MGAQLGLLDLDSDLQELIANKLIVRMNRWNEGLRIGIKEGNENDINC
jgi:hypothetical protein